MDWFVSVCFPNVCQQKIKAAVLAEERLFLSSPGKTISNVKFFKSSIFLISLSLVCTN